MSEEWILEHLTGQGAVHTGSHFVYTNGGHGTAYINMRAVAHEAAWLEMVGETLAHRLSPYHPDVVIGPETLGRTLACMAAPYVTPDAGIWCDIHDSTDGGKLADFSGKLGFHRLVDGKRVAIIDDLLTTGSSVAAVSRLVREQGGTPVVAGVVVRRTPDVVAEDCGVPDLEVLVEIEGFQLFTAGECVTFGPCSQRVPVVERPGHGWRWAEHHPDYPTIPRPN